MTLSRYKRPVALHPRWRQYARAVLSHHFTLAYALAYFFAASVNVASAHDFWINGKAVDPATKKLCCGENDCHMVEATMIKVTAQGYKMDDTGETIAFGRAQPSPDGDYWRCRWGGETQCFFAPPQGY